MSQRDYSADPIPEQREEALIEAARLALLAEQKISQPNASLLQRLDLVMFTHQIQYAELLPKMDDLRATGDLSAKPAAPGTGLKSEFLSGRPAPDTGPDEETSSRAAALARAEQLDLQLGGARDNFGPVANKLRTLMDDHGIDYEMIDAFRQQKKIDAAAREIETDAPQWKGRPRPAFLPEDPLDDLARGLTRDPTDAKLLGKLDRYLEAGIGEDGIMEGLVWHWLADEDPRVEAAGVFDAKKALLGGLESRIFAHTDGKPLPANFLREERQDWDGAKAKVLQRSAMDELAIDLALDPMNPQALAQLSGAVAQGRVGETWVDRLEKESNELLNASRSLRENNSDHFISPADAFNHARNDAVQSLGQRTWDMAQQRRAGRPRSRANDADSGPADDFNFQRFTAARQTAYRPADLIVGPEATGKMAGSGAGAMHFRENRDQWLKPVRTAATSDNKRSKGNRYE